MPFAEDEPDPKNMPTEEEMMGQLRWAPTNSRPFFAEQSVDDQGSRYKHLSELAAMWEDAVALMEQRNFLGKADLIKVMGMRLGLQQLRSTIAGIAGYSEYVSEIRTLVDSVPRNPDKIYGGRGTAIKPWTPGTDSNEGVS
jgi:hypothetical protein